MINSPIAEVCSQDSSNRTAGVHDAEEVKGTEATSIGNAPSATCNIFHGHSPPLCPVLEVEEDGIEAEKNEAHGGDEPCIRSLVKCLFIDPNLLLKPLFRDS